MRIWCIKIGIVSVLHLLVTIRLFSYVWPMKHNLWQTNEHHAACIINIMPIYIIYVYLFVYNHLSNLHLFGGYHHYRWQGYKFRLLLSTYGFYKWGFSFVPHLLRHRASLYTVSSNNYWKKKWYLIWEREMLLW
jgi:hypothetical protein